MLARKRKSVSDVETKGNSKDHPLESMLDLLKCSKCDQLPTDGKVWMSGTCVHKYCKSCIQKSRHCVTCEIAITPRDRVLDDFSTKLLSELLRFQQILKEQKISTKDELATGAMKENIEEQTDDIVVMKEVEAPVLEKCDSKEEKGGRKSRTSLSALFGLSEEDEVMEEELDPDLPALTPHPPSPEKKPLSQNSRNKLKSKNPTVLLSRLEILDKEQSGSKKSKGRQQKKLSTIDDGTDDDDSIFGTPNSRSSRRSSRRRSPSEEKAEPKVEVESNRKSKRQKKFFLGRESGSRDSSNNSRERIIEESVKHDSGRKKLEESDTFIASTRRSKKGKEEEAVDVPSPAKSDIYEFKSQSTKPKPKTTKRQQRRRKDSDSSATSSSILDSPKPEKKHEFIKPPPRSISTSGSDIVKDVKSSPSASNVNKKNAKGETPLHIAVRNGKLEKAKELVDAGADVDAKDYAGWTPLHEAICAKIPSLDMVKFLVTSGADVHALGLNNSTPLHEASRRGLRLIVKYLLSESASPALRTSEGKLPVDLAKDAAVRKVFTEWEKKSVNQSQSTQISVELKISLQNAIFFFDYNPEKDFLRNCQQVLDIKVSKELSKEVTHVVFCAKPKEKVPPSFNYIVSILNGCWMLSSKWLEDSLDVKRFLDPNMFQIGGCQYENIPSSNGGTCDSAVERARINREHGNPSLFHGFNFYIYKNSSWAINNDGGKEKKNGEEKKGSGGGKKLSLSGHSSCVFNKKDLAKLIAFGDGAVINREPNPDMVDPLESPERFHAAQHNKTPHKLCLTSHVVLYDDKNIPPNKYDMEHVKTIKTDWLIHSAVHFKLLMPDSYLE